MTVNDKINIHIASDEKMNKDFVDACLRAERDEITEPENHLYFEDAKTLLHVLSNQRLSLLSILFQLGHTSIRALSKKMNRNYKNVYGDVQL